MSLQKRLQKDNECDMIIKTGKGRGERALFCKIRSLGLHGVTGYEVTAECDLSGGLPNFTVVGLPDTAVNEARALQVTRYGADGPQCNARMGQKELERY